MSASNSRFSVAITADDQTAKGVKSAEKRIGSIPKTAGSVNRAQAKATQDAIARSSRGILRTFAQVEQASARAFGGRSLTSGLTNRLSAVREAGAAAGSGLGEAASAGGLLEGTLGAVGVAAGATVGLLAAAGYAAFKLADGWAKGAASMGRMADIIGVGAKELQEFNAAAERQGVDKGTSTSAIGGLSQTLNDARYGRNNEAIALLSRWGVKLQLNQDGTVNIGAMLPAIANALAKQNSSGRRTAARILGMGDAALPAFTQGGQALSAAMKDSENTAYIATPGDIETAKRIQGKEAIVGQMKDRAIAAAGAATATAGEGALDGTISTGRGIISGVGNFGGIVSRTFAPAADKIARGGAAIERAARMFVDKTGIIGAIRHAAADTGTDANMLLRIAAHESGLNPQIRAKTSSASGLFQFIDKTWLGMVGRFGAQHGVGWAADAVRNGQAGPGSGMRARILGLRSDPYLNAVMGGELAKSNDRALMPVLGRHATIAENYMANFLGAGGASRFFKAEHANPKADASAAFPAEAAANRGIFFGGGGRHRSLEEVLGLMASFVERPIKVQIEAHGLPSGSKIKTTAGHGSAPAVSHAMVE